MANETPNDALPTPGTLVWLVLRVAARLLGLYVLVICVLLVPVVVYCATR